MLWSILFICLVLTTAGLWLGLGTFRRRSFRRRFEKAKHKFAKHQLQLEGLFLETASQSGKPRGLLWKKCDFDGDTIFARDISTSEIYALSAVTISFEAVVGGDMEDVEAVSNLRCATAVFSYKAGHWTTDGRTVFNLEPHEAIERYSESLEPIQRQDLENSGV